MHATNWSLEVVWIKANVKNERERFTSSISIDLWWDASLLFENRKVLVITHQQFVKFGIAITFSNLFFPFIPFTCLNFHEPFGKILHTKQTLHLTLPQIGNIVELSFYLFCTPLLRSALLLPVWKILQLKTRKENRWKKNILWTRASLIKVSFRLIWSKWMCVVSPHQNHHYFLFKFV
jgi:hypothetical protein